MSFLLIILVILTMRGSAAKEMISSHVRTEKSYISNMLDAASNYLDSVAMNMASIENATNHTSNNTHNSSNHTHNSSNHTQNSSNHTQNNSNHTHNSSNHTHNNSNHTHNSSNHTHNSSNHTHNSSNHTHKNSNHTQHNHSHHSNKSNHSYPHHFPPPPWRHVNKDKINAKCNEDNEDCCCLFWLAYPNGTTDMNFLYWTPCTEEIKTDPHVYMQDKAPCYPSPNLLTPMYWCHAEVPSYFPNCDVLDLGDSEAVQNVLDEEGGCSSLVPWTVGSYCPWGDHKQE